MSALPGMRDRTILMGGFSKAYAMTGWRVGWLCAPAHLLEGIVKVHQYAIMSAPTMAQDAALRALTDGERDVQAMVAEYDRRRRLVVDGFNALGLPTFEPRGAFYAFPEVTTATGLDSETFAARLLQEEHVAVVPGGAFGPSGEGHVRACYATSYDGPGGGAARASAASSAASALPAPERSTGRRPAGAASAAVNPPSGGSGPAGGPPRSPRSPAAAGTATPGKSPRSSYASGVRNQRPRS